MIKKFPYVDIIIEKTANAPSSFSVSHRSFRSLFTVADFLEGISLAMRYPKYKTTNAIRKINSVAILKHPFYSKFVLRYKLPTR